MGRRYGHYEVIRELGRGGMGVVYAARHPQLAREVALKTLFAEVADEEDLIRFRREGEALARLRHPGIVPVHELGVAGSEPYLVMALVDGESLQRRLDRQGPLDAPAAARLIASVADGLQHAHEAGVLHRDVKPDNVLLSSDDRPLLTDFGLAGDLSREKERLTRTGQTLGTPSFMPPEQAFGDPRAIGPASDVYGLGATLYAALCGAPPFSGPSALAILDAVITQPPVAPRRLNPAVPADLEAICLRCLRKEPSERYATAAELSADLARFLEGERTEARERQRSLAPLIGVALAVLLASAGVAVWALGEPAPEPKPTRTARRAPTPPPERPQTSPSPKPRLKLEPVSFRPLDPTERLAAARAELEAGGDPGPFVAVCRSLADDEALAPHLRSEAMRALAEQLPNERGQWLLAAARLSDHRAMLELGYQCRRAGNTRDAAGWFEAATTGEATRAEACRALAEDAYHRGETVTARRWYEGLVAADPDDAFAKLRLGMLLRDAATTPEQGERAVEILEASARGGNVHAWVKLGEVFDFKELPGVEIDKERARECYERAGEGGYEWGWLNLGNMYETGAGGPADPAEAARCFKKAHDRGLRAGAFRLGQLLIAGRGVTRNLESADRFLAIAHDEQSKGQAAHYYRKALYERGKLLHSGQLGEERKAEGLDLLRTAAREGHGGARDYLGRQQ